MEYIKTLKEKLFYFSSVLSVKYHIKFNEYIFALPESEADNPVSIFLHMFFMKYSEKLSDDINMPIYLSFILVTLEQLQFQESQFLIDSNENFEIIKKEFLQCFTTSAFNKFKKLSDLHCDLEIELKNMNSHLFLPDEISILPILLIKSILESEDISNPNLLIRSVNEQVSPFSYKLNLPSIENCYIFKTDYSKKIIKIIDHAENFIMLVFSADLIQYINTGGDCSKLFTILINSGVNLIFCLKKIEDKLAKKFFDNKIIIVDKYNLEEYNRILEIYEPEVLTTNSILEEDINFLDKFLPKNLNKFSLQIINKVYTDNLYIRLIENDENNLNAKCRTICIQKYIGKADEERRSTLNKMIKEYAGKILNMLNFDSEENLNNIDNMDKLSFISFGEFYELLYNHNKRIIRDIITQIDKIILYKFNSVKEELTSTDLKEIRGKVIISQEKLKELIEIISMIVNN